MNPNWYYYPPVVNEKELEKYEIFAEMINISYHDCDDDWPFFFVYDDTLTSENREWIRTPYCHYPFIECI